MQAMRVGLLGLGTVGRGTWTVLKRNAEVFHEIASDGGWQPERERLTFAWFTTQGSFSRTTTGTKLCLRWTSRITLCRSLSSSSISVPIAFSVDSRSPACSATSTTR